MKNPRHYPLPPPPPPPPPPHHFTTLYDRPEIQDRDPACLACEGGSSSSNQDGKDELLGVCLPALFPFYALG